MGKPTPPPAAARPSPRCARRLIVQRWLQLLDDAEHLEGDIHEAPTGTFAPAELDDVLLALERALHHLLGSRPKIPQSRLRPRTARRSRASPRGE